LAPGPGLVPVSKMLLRVFLVGVVLGSLTVRHRSIEIRNSFITNYDMTTALSELLHDAGIELLENPVEPPRVLPQIVYYQQPDCDERSLVMPFAINNDAVPLLRRVGIEGQTLTYIYFDSSWDSPNRTAMFVQWVRQSITAMFPASEFVPLRRAIVRAEPVNCGAPEQVEWQNIWRKTFIEGMVSGAQENRRGGP